MAQPDHRPEFLLRAARRRRLSKREGIGPMHADDSLAIIANVAAIIGALLLLWGLLG